MAISVSINADDTAPAHGQLVTFTYVVDGNDAIDPSSAVVSGAAVVGGVRYDVSTTMTAPGTPPASEQFEVPAADAPGWTFNVTSEPNIFTCAIP
jgi:hypothetical protein